MKNKKKNQKNIYTLFSLSMVIVLSLSYIICIYKTVVLASDMEINDKKILSLSADINKKEFEYIGKISDIDLEKALSLGYVKNVEDKVVYFSIKDNSELAVR